MKKLFTMITILAIAFTLGACTKSGKEALDFSLSIKPTEFSEETTNVLKMLGDDLQFFDMTFDDTVKFYTVKIWIFRGSEWEEAGATYDDTANSGKNPQIAVRLMESNLDVFSINKDGYSKGSFSMPEKLFENSRLTAVSKIDAETPLELNKETTIWAKLGRNKAEMPASWDIIKDFRSYDCNAGVAVTLTVSDKPID